MYADELATTEAVLRAYPDALSEKQARENYLQGKIVGGHDPESTRVQGGTGENIGDRYSIAADSDKKLYRARTICSAVRNGLKELNASEDKCVRSVYFENRKPAEAAAIIGLSTSYVRQAIESGRAKLAEFCIPVYPLVCQMREDIEEARREVLRKENK